MSSANLIDSISLTNPNTATPDSVVAYAVSSATLTDSLSLNNPATLTPTTDSLSLNNLATLPPSTDSVATDAVTAEVPTVDNEEDDADPPCIPDASISDSSEDESGYKLRFRNQTFRNLLQRQKQSIGQAGNDSDQL